MSPGDFKLIFNGLKRGSIVQFDRGDLGKLSKFVEAHRDQFSDIHQMLDELRACENIYRNSVPDITHNHIRLLYDADLWRTILSNAVAGWKVRNIIDEQNEAKFHSCKISTILFFLIGLIPFLGRFIRRIWAHDDWRKHYAAALTSWGYFKRSIEAKIAEKVIIWHRAGRMDDERSIKVTESVSTFLCHLPFSILPAGLHRFLTDRAFRKEKLVYIFVRPVRLYFNVHLREEWMRQMVIDGKKKHIITDEDGNTILSQLNERYIQRYLVSLVVHILTLPVTQIVSGIHIIVWNMMHPEATPAQRTAISLAIGVIYQVIPISPGSFCRGLYTTILAIHDRSFKDYNIALFLSYVKYVGYLAFPIQMSYHYPAISRFMAGHWATDATHIVPVFGERGALLEHWVFCLFYNWPLTIRRRMRSIGKMRASLRPRYWHAGLCIVSTVSVLGLASSHYLANVGTMPGLAEIWWLAIALPLTCGVAVTLGCGGAILWKRIVTAATCGVLAGLLYTFVWVMVGGGQVSMGSIMIEGRLNTIIFGLLSTIGALAAELTLPEPDLRR
jgi:hypothetical protein